MALHKNCACFSTLWAVLGGAPWLLWAAQGRGGWRVLACPGAADQAGPERPARPAPQSAEHPGDRAGAENGWGAGWAKSGHNKWSAVPQKLVYILSQPINFWYT